MLDALVSPNGIPLQGFGTWPLSAAQARSAILMALEVGFRHIDTAQLYGNEAEVGAAVAASGLKRAEVFITTKVKPDNLSRAQFLPSVRRSLEDLQTDRADLLLIHWPPKQDFEAMIALLAEAKAQGLAARIGVSNFNLAMLQKAAALAPLVSLQVEFHALIDQSRMKAAADRLGLTVSAYTPLGRGAVMKDPAVQKVAAETGKPASEVALAWIFQQGVAAIPMTTKRANADSNFRARTLVLSPAQMAALTAASRQNRRFVNPPGWGPDWDG